MNGPRRNEGFTLIEVVVALAVLGVAVFALLEAHYGSVSLFVDAEDESRIDLVVGQAVAQAELQILSGTERGEGELGAYLPDYSYTFSAVQTNEIENPGLFEVTVTVRGPNLEREVNYLVYDGAQVDVGN
jgi:prepilin-type N-terminal cleavage/methylation domain-containing protein